MLQLLLAKLVLDVFTERDRALVLLTVLSVVATQRDKLLANGAATIGFSLATFCVLNNTFHLLAGRQRAVRVSTLTCVDEGLDATLDAEATRVSGALSGSGSLVAALIIQTKA